MMIKDKTMTLWVCTLVMVCLFVSLYPNMATGQIDTMSEVKEKLSNLVINGSAV